MKIAILGWGSLIKEPRGLPIVGEWQKDGPTLWIEFSRISKAGERAGCLTLVVDERHGSEVTTLHVLSQRTELTQAIADLREREGTSEHDIGFCEVAAGRFASTALSRHPKSCDRIRAWALGKGCDAAVWTALPCRFKDAIGIPFTPAAALKYLDGLPAPTRDRALQYIRNAPEQTMTAFRRLLLAQSSAERASPPRSESL
jgi:hypothetical protein